MPNTLTPSGWQLLSDLSGVAYPGGDKAFLAEALAAVQAIHVPAHHLEQIRRAFGRAIARAAGDDGLATPLPLRIRIWRLGLCTDDCGWGFFLVEKQTSGPAASTEHLIELFLYQEREC
jgi:hypothetical protein